MSFAAPPVALQLYTVRDVLKEDFAGGLGQVAGIGYEHVELAGLHGQSPAQVKKILDDLGVKAIASHENLDRLNNDIDAVIEQARLLGYEFIVCPFLPEAHRTLSGYRNVCRFLNELAGELAGQGLTICYHNHNFEFSLLEDASSRGMDILFDPAGSTALNSELDVYWVKKGGDEPLDWLEKLPGRVPLLHMKDMADTPDKGFAEVGTGVIDLKGLARAASGYGVRYLIVEQDRNWRDDDPMASAKISFDNLQAMIAE